MKHREWILAASAMFLTGGLWSGTAAGAYQDVVLADAPTAYWQVNESFGATALNLGSLGASANGRYSGSHTKGVDSLIAGPGTAILFSGGSISPRHVNGINRSGPFQQRTIELWFMANSLSGRQVLFEEGGGVRGLDIYLVGPTLYIAGWNRRNDDGGGAAAPWGNPIPVFVSAAAPVQVDTVYHVVLVMDGDATGTSGTITGYLNGESFGQAAGVGMIWNHNPVVIGNAAAGIRFHDNNTSTSNRDFDGVIDEVALYNAALSETQVQAHYSAGAGAALVGHWTLDETTGTTAADSSGNGNDGALFGTFTFDTNSVSPGQEGDALEFDGSSDSISVDSSASLQPTEALTIVAWAKADAWGSGAIVNSVVRKGEDGPVHYQLAVADGRVTLFLDEDDSGGVAGDTVLDAGRWYHIAGTWDGSDVRIYVNGELDNTPVPRSGTIGSDSRSLYIGGHAAANRFDGTLDDVRLYGYALTHVEISALYGLVGYWKFDETGAATRAADSSGNGHHADLFGDATWASGQVDGAIELDGKKDFATTITSFDPPPDGTVLFWMQVPDTTRKRQTLLGLDDDWEIRLESTGILTFDLGGDGSGNFITITPVNTPGKWRHIAAVFSAASNTYEVYVDGVLDKFGLAVLSPQKANPLTFGTRTGSSKYWEGALDDLRIYNRRLSLEEIVGLSGAGIPGKLRIVEWVEIR